MSACKHRHTFAYASPTGSYEARRLQQQANAERARAGEPPAPIDAFRRGGKNQQQQQPQQQQRGGDRPPRQVGPREDEVLECHPCYLAWKAESPWGAVTAACHRIEQCYLYLLARTPDDLLKHVENDTKAGRGHWFARVDPGIPLDLYLDLEEESDAGESAFFSRCLVAASFVLASLEADYGVSLARRCRERWLTSCAAPTKLSFHAHMALEDGQLAFRDVASLGAAMERARDRLDALERACPDHPVVIALRRKDAAAAKWILDFRVYTPSRNFRMAFQSKRPSSEQQQHQKQVATAPPKLEVDEWTGQVRVVASSATARPALRPLVPYDPVSRQRMPQAPLREWLRETLVLRASAARLLPAPADLASLEEDLRRLAVERLQNLPESATRAEKVVACISLVLRRLCQVFSCGRSDGSAQSLDELRGFLREALAAGDEEEEPMQVEGEEDELAWQGCEGALAVWWHSASLHSEASLLRGVRGDDDDYDATQPSWLSWVSVPDVARRAAGIAAEAARGERDWRALSFLGALEPGARGSNGTRQSLRDGLCRRLCLLSALTVGAPSRAEHLLYAWSEFGAPHADATAAGYGSDDDEGEEDNDDEDLPPSDAGWLCQPRGRCTGLRHEELLREAGEARDWEADASRWLLAIERSSCKRKDAPATPRTRPEAQQPPEKPKKIRKATPVPDAEASLSSMMDDSCRVHSGGEEQAAAAAAKKKQAEEPAPLPAPRIRFALRLPVRFSWHLSRLPRNADDEDAKPSPQAKAFIAPASLDFLLGLASGSIRSSY
jgi:hypothetical protein